MTSFTSAADVPEVPEIVERIKQIDGQYETRVANAQIERKELRRQLLRMTAEQELRRLRNADEATRWITNSRGWLPSAQLDMPACEVSGAGLGEVNGVYVAGMLPTSFVADSVIMVFRKPSTDFYMFRWQPRWHQTQWVIAELNGPYSMGNMREWLYYSQTQSTMDWPPSGGWQVGSQGRGSNPAPQVRVLEDDESLGDRISGSLVVLTIESLRRSQTGGASNHPRRVSSNSLHALSHQPATTAASFTMPGDVEGALNIGNDGDSQIQTSCRCGTSCGIM
jgi:hypothetical protein